MLWGREPVLYLTLVEVSLALAVGFGLELSGHQVTLIVAFIAGVLGIVARQRVTPAGLAQVRVDQAFRAGQRQQVERSES
jgi:hypothetical protein